MAKILVVTAGESGRGRTTIALNTASVLKRLGDEIILVDTEAHLPALGYDNAVFSNPYTLADVVKRGLELELAARDFNGIKYFIGSWNPTEFKEIPTEKILEIIDRLSSLADYIILDSAIAKDALNQLSATREVAMISKPLLEEVSFLQQLGTMMNGKRVGLVLNMIGKERFELSTRAIEFLTQMPVVGEIPYDSHVLLALSKRKPVVEINPGCPASKGILKFVLEFIRG